MAHTIGNPISWISQHLVDAFSHFSSAISHLGGDLSSDLPQVRQLTVADLRTALKQGAEDFAACRSDAMFLVLCYPLIGLGLVVMSLQVNLMPLIFPLILGFALLGPAAALGLYQMSARREQGADPDWRDAFAVIRSPALLSMMVLSAYLAALFIIWLVVAQSIYTATLGPEAPNALSSFLASVFTTTEGWTMILWGGFAGACFAIAALAVSILAFPLLLDRQTGVPVAVATSLRFFRKNPGVSLIWGVIIVGALLVGSLPAFAGLIVVFPILGHSTWHLYRRAVR